MNIEVLAATNEPFKLISLVAGVSHGKSDYSYDRVVKCIESRHDSVLEHVSATFRISGVSRACTHQLVRHRLMAVVEKSQRYTVVDSCDVIYVPQSINAQQMGCYGPAAAEAINAYYRLISNGAKPEDARFVLPQGTLTDIAITVNLRELDHIHDMRCADDAQWEIRGVVQGMWDRLAESDEQWWKLLVLLDERRAGGTQDGRS